MLETKALAVLTSMDLHFMGTSVRRVYTFGSPRVGNQIFAQAFDSLIGQTWRIVHYEDIVPHLPLVGLGFYHVARYSQFQKKKVLFSYPFFFAERFGTMKHSLLTQSVMEVEKTRTAQTVSRLPNIRKNCVFSFILSPFFLNYS